MDEQSFRNALQAQSAQLEQIRAAARRAHEAVNQHYDDTLPYSFHLDSVARLASACGSEVCAEPRDILPILFGAYFHDAIEDARLSYNDVRRQARLLGLSDKQSLDAAEIVFALTNDKGRTRAERAGEHYYQGIRQTPYAPMIKLADRTANLRYAAQHTNPANRRMAQIYKNEMPHFIASLRPDSPDPRLALPQKLLRILRSLL